MSTATITDTRYAKKITKFHVPEILEIVKDVVKQHQYSVRPYYHTSALASLRDDPTGGSLPPELPEETRKEWARRLQQANEKYGKRVIFDVCKLDDDKRAKILSMLPDCIKNENVELTMQDIYDGDYVTPHIDHKRKSSLFYLITENPDMETVWFTEKEPFTIYDNFRYPDMDKIQRDFTIVMQPNNWYLIDQETWHGAFRLPEFPQDTLRRIVFVIQFPDLGYKQMLKILGED